MYNDIHIGSIGIDYRGSPNQLHGCIADLKSWQAWAKPFATRSLTRTESEATVAGITSMVLDLFGGLKPGDLAILTRSGHGTQVPDMSGDETDRLDEAFVPYDYKQNLLLDDQYRQLLAKRPAGTYVMLVDDFCHSGTAARGYDALRVSPGMPRFVPFANLSNEMHGQDIDCICKRPRARGGLEAVDEGVIQITGCLDTEYSYDASFQTGPNGAATYFLIRAWNQLSVGSSFEKWFQTLRSYLPNRQKYPQTPQLNASDALKQWVVPGWRPPPVVPNTPPVAPPQLFTGRLDDGRKFKLEIG